MFLIREEYAVFFVIKIFIPSIYSLASLKT